jgi:predicted lactoylglutathione lyase
MARKLFVNLAVSDLDRSVEFFTGLGFTFNPAFTDETATCMVIGEDAYAMLLVEERFKDFALNEPVDANAQTQAILAVTVDSREEVDDLTEKALASGGAPAADPQEMDFMYSRSFRDPDGHHWELFWMDMSQVPHEAPAESSAT